MFVGGRDAGVSSAKVSRVDPMCGHNMFVPELQMSDFLFIIEKKMEEWVREFPTPPPPSRSFFLESTIYSHLLPLCCHFTIVASAPVN